MMEDFCLTRADQIVTVSQTNANCIQRRGVAAEKITVIPNIAAIPGNDGFQPALAAVDDGVPIILYAGTLTPWQGVPTLIKAFKLLADRADLRLVLACSTKKFLKPVRQLIKKLRLKNRVEIKIGLSREELHEYYQNAVFTVVPLTRCDRNELQGCCPLKILESMAVGTPVIASNVAVCRELIEHEKDGWLVTPDSPRSLAHAMQTLLDKPDLVSRLGQQAQHKITFHYNRETFTENLRRVYCNSDDEHECS
jgi:glycosyltransferase involved in cell wall biosynthesis